MAEYGLELKYESTTEWITCVLENFDDFLRDHADCERKASALAMSFVYKYPNRKEIIPELIETAIEELEHFQQVYKIMEEKQIPLIHATKPDTYINDLIKFCRDGREDRFMDRMILASVAEARGAERFSMVFKNLEDRTLKAFYHRLWASEARHGTIYVQMLEHYFDKNAIEKRTEEFLVEEARIASALPIRPALH